MATCQRHHLFINSWTSISRWNGLLQFYFGLPIAMIVICLIEFLYHKYKVYTAYEYLSNDLTQNPFARRNFILISTVRDGIDYLCPCNYLIKDTGWNLTYMNIVIGLLVIIYTFSGGTKAVNVTPKNSKILDYVANQFFFLILHFTKMK
jgi:hypothetical protein